MNLYSKVVITFGKLFFVLFFLGACEKVEEVVPIDNMDKIETATGVDIEDLEAFAGEIGIYFNARNIARLGYKPNQLKIKIKDLSSTNSSFTLTLDPLTLIGQLKFSLEELDATEADKLQDGVEIQLEIYDDQGGLIKEEIISNKSFKANPGMLHLDPQGLKDLNAEINLNSSTSFYLQVVDKAGNPTGQALTLMDLKLLHTNVKNAFSVGGPHRFDNSESQSLFRFRALDQVENGFVIYNEQAGKVLEHLKVNSISAVRAHYSEDRFFKWSEEQILSFPTLVFIIERQGNGIYTLKAGDGKGTLIRGPFGLFGEKQASSYTDEAIVRFRLIATDVRWDFESVESIYFDPIFPAAKTSFGFNNTLINCGKGSLVQDVGSSISETITRNTGWEESLSISTTHQKELSISMGLEVEGKFFGNGATYSANVTGKVGVTNNKTSEKARWESIDESEQESYFVNRTITIPPKSASLVVDALQAYDNINVHFVQRVRVRAQDAALGNDLSGKEMLSLIQFSGFDGVVTKVEPDYIEATIKGTTNIGKWIVAKSEVNDVEPTCNN